MSLGVLNLQQAQGLLLNQKGTAMCTNLVTVHIGQTVDTPYLHQGDQRNLDWSPDSIVYLDCLALRQLLGESTEVEDEEDFFD